MSDRRAFTGLAKASRARPAAPYPGRVSSGGVVSRLGLLAAVSAVAGILMAGMLLPIVGGIGLIARAGANDFESLPSVLKESPLPQVSRILAADGSTIATFYAEDRVAAPLSQVPDVMQKALIAIEDVRFYEHHGVDFKGSLRALLHNSSSGSVQQGGSTITQQYVKNMLIESGAPDATADTLARKAREARYALALEKTLTKQQILERYLNIAYFGDGAYGIGTAAQHYFGIPVSQLNLQQSALLAGLVQSPGAYDPTVHPAAARNRRDVVLGQMLRYHFISQTDYNTAVTSPVSLDVHVQGNGCEASRFPYFCDYVENVIKTSPTFGASPSARKSFLERGGLTIRTTLVPQVQRAADRALRNYVHPHEPTGVAGAEAVVEPGTGKVLAIAVSSEYGSYQKKHQNDINYAVDTPLGGGVGRFSMGSTFKLFVLAAALKEGFPLSTTIFAPPRITVSGFTDCAGNSAGSWNVHNAGDSEQGRFNLVTGTWFSVNTFFAQLEQRVGLCQTVKLAEAMGVREGDGKRIHQFPSFALGAVGHNFSVLDTAGAYATMAAHGQYCAPLAITKVTDRNGHNYAVPGPDCHDVVDPGLADTVTQILHGVLTQRGATAALVGEPGRPAAAKTGTAEDYSASDFAGYVPQMAAAVWVGNPHRPNSSLAHLTIGGRSYGNVFGATIGGPIWRDTLQAALVGVPVEQLPKADRRFVFGQTSKVPDVSGLAAFDAKTALTQAGFQVVSSTHYVASLFPAGTVAYTSPAAGSSAPQGATIVLFISNGLPPPTPAPSTPPPTPGGQPSTTPSQSPSSSPSAQPTKTRHPH
jgi:membrane peptidoglycan carboxypeptidase